MLPADAKKLAEELMSKHGFFDFQVKAKGDLEVDLHHTIEDIGILLGEALKKSLDNKKGIRRYGFAAVPMDEVLAQVAVDICNRAFLVYNLPIVDGKVGMFDIEVIKEFFQAFSTASGITLHINVPYGNNRHHIIEAVFKAFGRALCEFRVSCPPKDYFDLLAFHPLTSSLPFIIDCLLCVKINLLPL